MDNNKIEKILNLLRQNGYKVTFEDFGFDMKPINYQYAYINFNLDLTEEGKHCGFFVLVQHSLKSIKAVKKCKEELAIAEDILTKINNIIYN